MAAILWREDSYLEDRRNSTKWPPPTFFKDGQLPVEMKSHLSTDVVQIATQYRKQHSVSVTTKKCKSKWQRLCSILKKMVPSKRSEINKCWWGGATFLHCWKLELGQPVWKSMRSSVWSLNKKFLLIQNTSPEYLPKIPKIIILHIPIFIK